MLTKIVSSLILFFKIAKSINPSLVTGRSSTSKPCSCNLVADDTMELCSKLLIRICFPKFLYLSAIPLMAKLLDSLAPLV